MTESRDPAPILVPIDFSSDSEAALVWATSLAQWMGAPLLVLHVVHDLEHSPGYYLRALEKAGLAPNGEQLVRLEAAATELLREFLGRLAERCPALADARSMIVSGLPAPRILEVAKTSDAQHIVMGSQGRTGLSHVLLGSKAEHVVRLASVPVTIVKADQPFGTD